MPGKIKGLGPGMYQMLNRIIVGIILLVCPVLRDTRGKTCQSQVKFHEREIWATWLMYKIIFYIKEQMFALALSISKCLLLVQWGCLVWLRD